MMSVRDVYNIYIAQHCFHDSGELQRNAEFVVGGLKYIYYIDVSGN